MITQHCYAVFAIAINAGFILVTKSDKQTIESTLSGIPIASDKLHDWMAGDTVKIFSY